MGLMDKINKFNARTQNANGGTGGPRTKDIFHSFVDGKNRIRLVGEFIETHSHFIAPSQKLGTRGCCPPHAFQGDGALSKMINCPDWDLDEERPTPKKTCPICRLNREARADLRAIRKGEVQATEDEKKALEEIRDLTRTTIQLKWNVIDRDNPMITQVDDQGNEQRVPGMKVANIGMEAWSDINKLFSTVERNIADDDEGMDIFVIKEYSSVKGRMCYSATLVMQGTHAVETPLTDEERAMPRHDLRRISGQYPDVEKLLDCLHEDLRSAVNTDEEVQDERHPCFGTMEDPERAECVGCEYFDDCKEESGV